MVGGPLFFYFVPRESRRQAGGFQDSLNFQYFPTCKSGIIEATCGRAREVVWVVVVVWGVGRCNMGGLCCDVGGR